MFSRVGIVSVPVSDQDAAKTFYTEKLGCRVTQDMPMGPEGGPRWLTLALPGVETQIVLVTWFPQMPPGCLQGVVLMTDNMAQTYEVLKQRGVKLSEVNKQPYGLEATFSDPDGNGWVLEQLGPG